ncbi:MAG: hypothetical protein NTY28_01920 [Janthinobacterium sp.]|nr:hypothetical protein [Janthinobacterium sp.]
MAAEKHARRAIALHLYQILRYFFLMVDLARQALYPIGKKCPAQPAQNSLWRTIQLNRAC